MPTVLTIALLEDHGDLRAATANFIRSLGHTVIEFESVEALEYFVLERSIDIYVIDVNLPGEDGLSFLRRLRGLEPTVGVIVVTARGGAENISEGYLAGADIYLTKPIPPKLLKASLESLQNRRERWHLKSEGLSILSSSMKIMGPSGEADLTSSEMNLLIGLTRAPGRKLDSYQVAELMGQNEKAFNKASLEVRIVRLRKKLKIVGAQTNCIRSERLFGYKLSESIQII